MSNLLDERRAHAEASPADQLRATMAAARVSLRWLGIRKTLSVGQRTLAAEAFGAEETFLTAGKKLLDNRHPAFRAVTAVRGRLLNYVKGASLPYPEPGLRLIRQDRIEEFNTRMREFREELEEVVRRLDAHYGELRQAARQRLGTLFDPSDYPPTLLGLFDIAWEFPAVEPPDYLRQLNPELYRQECDRMRERFGEAVRLAEAAFATELARLVSHLTERLAGTEDGRPKIFRDSAITNLTDFFERFRRLHIGSSDELDRLVADASRIVRGIAPGELRDNGTLRQHVATEMSRVQSVLDGLLVDRPRRNILRRPK